MRRCFAIACALLLSSCEPADPEIDQRAGELIDLTRGTRSNFIVISDVFVAFEGMKSQRFEGGEFHAGFNHRIEDPNNRVVANCSTQQGHQLWIPDSKRNSGEKIAAAACGIGPASATATVRYLGMIEYKFGKASRVQIDDEEFLRTYDVMPTGAIVRNIWQKKPDNTVAYKSDVKAYCETALPDSAFVETSLDQSFLTADCKN